MLKCSINTEVLEFTNLLSDPLRPHHYFVQPTRARPVLHRNRCRQTQDNLLHGQF